MGRHSMGYTAATNIGESQAYRDAVKYRSGSRMGYAGAAYVARKASLGRHARDIYQDNSGYEQNIAAVRRIMTVSALSGVVHVCRDHR